MIQVPAKAPLCQHHSADAEGATLQTGMLQTGVASSSRGEFPPDELKTAIRSLLPRIRARAAECERARSVPAETVAELRELGFYKLVQPSGYGGYEQDFAILADLMMELAGACASTAWVCGLLAAHQWMVGTFPAQAQRDVWRTNPDATFCGSYAPVTEAVPDAGGFRLSGRWGFASGCDNSSWAICGARPPAAADRPGQPAFLLVPASDYAIEDTWDVIGLAGTGSKTLVLKDVFVPEYRVLLFDDAASGRTPGSRLYSNRFYAVPVYCQVSACLAAPAIGGGAGGGCGFVRPRPNHPAARSRSDRRRSAPKRPWISPTAHR